MDETKNSRRAATDAGSSPDFPSKNSRRGIGSKNGVREVTPSGAPPSKPSKNSRRGAGAKTDPSEVTPSITPTDADRYDGIAPSESERNGREASATTLQAGGQNSPVPVGGATPPTQEADGHDGSDSPADIAELSARVEAMRRQQRISALRGALLVFMPSVVLCIPLVILKGCKLLLLSWWWCFSPLLLWLIPLASILSIFIRCYSLYRQQERQDREAADKADKSA